MRRGGLSRREILQGGGIAVVGAGGLTLGGLAGYAWPHDKAAAASLPTAPATPTRPGWPRPTRAACRCWPTAGSWSAGATCRTSGEFAADGTLLLDGQFPVGDQSYRAFTADWAGHPADKPAVAARVNPAGGSVVYASWNGATELDTWTVLAGTAPGALAKAGSQRRAGFETAITVNTKGPYFAVTAGDASGRVLAQSATVRLEK